MINRAREALSALSARTSSAVKHTRALDQFVRFNPLVIWQVDRTLRASDALANPEQRRRLRDKHVRRSLTWAQKTEYGRQVGLNSDEISTWPVLEKAKLQGDEATFTNRRVPSVGATTGGTTGSPLTLRRSVVSLSAEQVFLDRMLAPYGVSFRRSRFAVLRGEDVKPMTDTDPPYGLTTSNGHRLSLSSQHLNSQTVSAFVDELNRFEADFLWVYPSTVSTLARLIGEHELTCRIPIIVSSSEILGLAERQMLTEVFGARVIDYYGQAERVAFAVSLEPGSARFEPLYGRVVLTDTGAVDDTFNAAEIIATGFWNQAMPLINYRTGDEILYQPSGEADQLQKIADGEIDFHSIRGRTNDFLRSADGGILVGIDHFARPLLDVLRLQVVQTTLDEVRIRVLNRGTGLTDRDRRSLEMMIAKKLPTSMNVSIDVVSELETAANGKTPFVIRSAEVDATIQ